MQSVFKRKKILIFGQNKRNALPKRIKCAMILVVAKIKNTKYILEVFPLYDYDITANDSCQIDELLQSLKPKREWGKQAADWLVGHVSIDQQARYSRCGDYITLLGNDDLSKKKIETAFFCGMRMCPGCAWRESLRSATCISAISQEMSAQKRIMIMLTLTVRNVPGDQLRETCLHVNKSWDRLIRRARYRAAWADNIRKMEITYNAQRDDYHPHLHVIVYVRPGYFNSKKYISRAQLLEDWKQATGFDNITQVHITRCRDLNNRSQAVLEVSKYAAKASDFCYSQSVFDVFFKAMSHLRTMSYSGICKQLRQDFIAGRLNKYLPVDDTKYVWRLVYQYFANTGYINVDTEAYTPPTPAGFHELVGNITPWKSPTALELSEVT